MLVHCIPHFIAEHLVSSMCTLFCLQNLHVKIFFLWSHTLSVRALCRSHPHVLLHVWSMWFIRSLAKMCTIWLSYLDVSDMISRKVFACIYLTHGHVERERGGVHGMRWERERRGAIGYAAYSSLMDFCECERKTTDDRKGVCMWKHARRT